MAAILFAGAFAAAMLGLKLSLIAEYGSAMPYWDQWDIEAVLLYKPYAEGTFYWNVPLQAHNEHRILWTRLLALGVFVANGQWNPLLQLVVNALLHIAALLFAIFAIARATCPQALPPLLLFSLMAFGIPYGWENTLMGTQSCFYLLLLFSTVSLWLLLRHPPLSAWWWAGFGCAIAAFLSLSAGSLVFLAASLVAMLRMTVGRSLTARGVAAAALLAAGFAVCHVLTPELQFHAGLRAQSVAQGYAAAVTTLSWPLPPSEACVLIRNAPAILFSLLLLTRRHGASSDSWFVFGFAVWTVGVGLALAYGRAASPLLSRYLDLIALAVLANAACALALALQIPERRHRLIALPLAWMVAVMLAFAGHGSRQVAVELAYKRQQSRLQEENVAAFLRTGDRSYLRGKPPQAIPYPDPEILAGYLADPTIRSFLPASIRSAGGLPEVTGRFDSAVRYLVERFRVFLALGAALAIIALSVFRNAPGKPAAIARTAGPSK